MFVILFFSFFVNIGCHTCEIASSTYISCNNNSLEFHLSHIATCMALTRQLTFYLGLHAKTCQHPTSTHIYIQPNSNQHLTTTHT